jgi:hypothetical protein
VDRGLPQAAKPGSMSLLAHDGRPVKYPPTTLLLLFSVNHNIRIFQDYIGGI